MKGKSFYSTNHTTNQLNLAILNHLIWAINQRFEMKEKSFLNQ